jgi:hypothetical protein
VRYGNCWLWALPRWLRGKKRYLIVRKSNHTIWPHVMLTDDLRDVEIEEFTADEVKKGWKAFFHAPFFKGHVRKGKDE